jgi:HD-GYP domain-containing protein (c-di-GMP phosphodiesterase class II)
MSLALGELLCAFAYASDLAFGLQLDDSLRSCYLAFRIADQLDIPDDERTAVYYTALLKDAGCTSWTTELANAWQTDEIVARRELVIFGNPNDLSAFMSWMTKYVASDRSTLSRLARYVNVLTATRSLFAEGFATTAMTACRVATRLSLPEAVQEAALNLFEQWNGSGAPSGLRGDEIPRISRIVFPTFFLAPFHRVSGREGAVQVARAFRGQAFDPEVVDAFLDLSTSESFWADLEAEQIRDRVIALEPRTDLAAVAEERIDDVALAFADFIDLKSRFAAAHSRRVGILAEEVARLMDCAPSAITQIRRAALMHDLGQVAIPSYSLDRPWSDLSEPERDQYRLHPYHGERILKQVPPLQPLAEMVGTHQERADGSGSYRGLTGTNISLGARIISAVDRLDELTHDAPGVPARSLPEALAQVRREPFDSAVVTALAKAVGEPYSEVARPRAARPAGLTEREQEILRLAASGLTRRAIAQKLYLSENTVRHHLEHVYNKTGTTNRVSATLFAMENGILSGPSL